VALCWQQRASCGAVDVWAGVRSPTRTLSPTCSPSTCRRLFWYATFYHFSCMGAWHCLRVTVCPLCPAQLRTVPNGKVCPAPAPQCARLCVGYVYELCVCAVTVAPLPLAWQAYIAGPPDSQFYVVHLYGTPYEVRVAAASPLLQCLHSSGDAVATWWRRVA
jgi:hypothetical protein